MRKLLLFLLLFFTGCADFDAYALGRQHEREKQELERDIAFWQKQSDSWHDMKNRCEARAQESKARCGGCD